MLPRAGGLALLLLAFLGTVAAQDVITACRQQYLTQMAALGQSTIANKTYMMIDPDTPDSACTLQLCQGNFAACAPGGPGKTEALTLVFSDEFEKEGRKFDVQSRDPRWTAEDIYYFPTQDIEVYKPEQITTWKGKAVITIEKAHPPLSAKSLQPDGKVWDVPKNFKSAMVNSWNKFCYTGGYVEMSVQMPGTDTVPGFWPAFWMMGNLGRAGYMPSTSGLWPYSFATCGEGSSKATAISGSKVPSQIFPSCIFNVSDPNWVNMTKYGMEFGKARNAPEFDVFEVVTVRGKGSEASQTLQMAPLIPPGQSWTDLEWYDQRNLEYGVQYPGSLTSLNTNFNGWTGEFGRPGNAYQDSLSAVSHLNASFYQGQHTFGIDWAPGEYLRWYVDGLFAYEINPNALLAREGTFENGTKYTIGDRFIPLEPMYIIFNLGMSRDFGEVDIENLPFPSYMLIDYIRVYQRSNKLNVGCSPPDYPTEQWINCHKNKYTTNAKADEPLFGVCNGAGAAQRGAAVAVAALAAAAMLLL